jgi:hypothetical protein
MTPSSSVGGLALNEPVGGENPGKQLLPRMRSNECSYGSVTEASRYESTFVNGLTQRPNPGPAAIGSLARKACGSVVPFSGAIGARVA